MGMMWRALRARPLLIAGVLVGVAAYVLLGQFTPLTRVLIAWDIACLVFLTSCAVKFSRAPTHAMREDANAQEEGEWTIFWLTVAGVAASFAAIIGEFSTSAGASPSTRGLHVILVAVTLFFSWLLTHTVFALRYAHEYYETAASGSGDQEGLEFPGERDPDYWDFFYFALVLGMTFQVSDVQITSHHFRRLAAAHGLLGFLFNTVILALTVNIGAGLIQPASGG